MAAPRNGRKGFGALAPRERDVLRAYAVYGRYAPICHALDISYQTMKNYATSVMYKLDAESFGHAAILYDRWAAGQEWPEVERRSGWQRRRGEERRRGERRKS